jgi:hypothetical protein
MPGKVVKVVKEHWCNSEADSHSKHHKHLLVHPGRTIAAIYAGSFVSYFYILGAS